MTEDDIRKWFKSGVPLSSLYIIVGPEELDKAFRRWLEEAEGERPRGARKLHMGLRRKVLTLLQNHCGGLTADEIAARLGLDPVRVRGAISTGRRDGLIAGSRGTYTLTRSGEEYCALIGRRARLMGFHKQEGNQDERTPA